MGRLHPAPAASLSRSFAPPVYSTPSLYPTQQLSDRPVPSSLFPPSSHLVPLKPRFLLLATSERAARWLSGTKRGRNTAWRARRLRLRVSMSTSHPLHSLGDLFLLSHPVEPRRSSSAPPEHGSRVSDRRSRRFLRRLDDANGVETLLLLSFAVPSLYWS